MRFEKFKQSYGYEKWSSGRSIESASDVLDVLSTAEISAFTFMQASDKSADPWDSILASAIVRSYAAENPSWAVSNSTTLKLAFMRHRSSQSGMSRQVRENLYSVFSNHQMENCDDVIRVAKAEGATIGSDLVLIWQAAVFLYSCGVDLAEIVEAWDAWAHSMLLEMVDRKASHQLNGIACSSAEDKFLRAC